jgi:hypothetical protein
MKSSTALAIVCLIILIVAGVLYWYLEKSKGVAGAEVKIVGTLLSLDIPGLDFDYYTVKVDHVVQDTSDGYLSRVMNNGGSIGVKRNIAPWQEQGTIDGGMSIGFPVEVYGTFKQDGDLGIPFISLNGKREYYLRVLVIG